MKKLIYTVSLCVLFTLFTGIITGQNWIVQSESGSMNIKAIEESGALLDVVAILDEGDDCFMDVKAVKGNKIFPVKLIASDSMEIPVAAVTPSGGNLAVVGIDAMGTQYPVKGISRFGNTIRIVIIESGSFREIVAVSPDGKIRTVTGLKFKEENVEMEIGPSRIVAHVKAIPSMEVKTAETSWDIKATGNDGSILEVVAVGKKGKERSVRALSRGGSYAMLNVKAEVGRDMVPVKLIKRDGGIFMTAVDYYGRKFQLKAKKADGTYIDIIGGENCGKTIDIRAASKDGVEYMVNAISPEGDMYDLKGIKLLDVDKEGYLQGLEGLIIFYAHVKALPPVQ